MSNDTDIVMEISMIYILTEYVTHRYIPFQNLLFSICTRYD